MQAMKRRREEVGVDMFGQQEQLAKAQVALDQLDAEAQHRARARSEAQADLDQLKEQASDQAAVVSRENKQVCAARQPGLACWQYCAPP